MFTHCFFTHRPVILMAPNLRARHQLCISIVPLSKAESFSLHPKVCVYQDCSCWKELFWHLFTLLNHKYILHSMFLFSQKIKVNIKQESLNLDPMVLCDIYQSPEIAYKMCICTFFFRVPQCSVIKESRNQKKNKNYSLSLSCLSKLNREVYPPWSPAEGLALPHHH